MNGRARPGDSSPVNAGTCLTHGPYTGPICTGCATLPELGPTGPDGADGRYSAVGLIASLAGIGGAQAARRSRTTP